MVLWLVNGTDDAHALRQMLRALDQFLIEDLFFFCLVQRRLLAGGRNQVSQGGCPAHGFLHWPSQRHFVPAPDGQTFFNLFPHPPAPPPPPSPPPSSGIPPPL